MRLAKNASGVTPVRTVALLRSQKHLIWNIDIAVAKAKLTWELVQ